MVHSGTNAQFENKLPDNDQEDQSTEKKDDKPTVAPKKSCIIELAYRCKECIKSFALVEDLHTHIQNVHEAPCDVKIEPIDADDDENLLERFQPLGADADDKLIPETLISDPSERHETLLKEFCIKDSNPDMDATDTEVTEPQSNHFLCFACGHVDKSPEDINNHYLIKHKEHGPRTEESLISCTSKEMLELQGTESQECSVGDNVSRVDRNVNDGMDVNNDVNVNDFKDDVDVEDDIDVNDVNEDVDVNKIVDVNAGVDNTNHVGADIVARDEIDGGLEKTDEESTISSIMMLSEKQNDADSDEASKDKKKVNQKKLAGPAKKNKQGRGRRQKTVDKKLKDVHVSKDKTSTRSINNENAPEEKLTRRKTSARSITDEHAPEEKLTRRKTSAQSINNEHVSDDNKVTTCKASTQSTNNVHKSEEKLTRRKTSAQSTNDLNVFEDKPTRGKTSKDKFTKQKISTKSTSDVNESEEKLTSHKSSAQSKSDLNLSEDKPTRGKSSKDKFTKRKTSKSMNDEHAPEDNKVTRQKASTKSTSDVNESVEKLTSHKTSTQSINDEQESEEKLTRHKSSAQSKSDLNVSEDKPTRGKSSKDKFTKRKTSKSMNDEHTPEDNKVTRQKASTKSTSDVNESVEKLTSHKTSTQSINDEQESEEKLTRHKSSSQSTSVLNVSEDKPTRGKTSKDKFTKRKTSTQSMNDEHAPEDNKVTRQKASTKSTSDVNESEEKLTSHKTSTQSISDEQESEEKLTRHKSSAQSKSDLNVSEDKPTRGKSSKDKVTKRKTSTKSINDEHAPEDNKATRQKASTKSTSDVNESEEKFTSHKTSTQSINNQHESEEKLTRHKSSAQATSNVSVFEDNETSTQSTNDVNVFEDNKIATWKNSTQSTSDANDSEDSHTRQKSSTQAKNNLLNPSKGKQKRIRQTNNLDKDDKALMEAFGIIPSKVCLNRVQKSPVRETESNTESVPISEPELITVDSDRTGVKRKTSFDDDNCSKDPVQEKKEILLDAFSKRTEQNMELNSHNDDNAENKPTNLLDVTPSKKMRTTRTKQSSPNKNVSFELGGKTDNELLKQFGLKEMSVKLTNSPVKVNVSKRPGPKCKTMQGGIKLASLPLNPKVSLAKCTKQVDEMSEDEMQEMLRKCGMGISVPIAAVTSSNTGQTDGNNSNSVKRKTSPEPSTSHGHGHLKRRRTARKSTHDSALFDKYKLKDSKVILKNLSRIDVSLLRNPNSPFGKTDWLKHKFDSDSESDPEWDIPTPPMMEEFIDNTKTCSEASIISNSSPCKESPQKSSDNVMLEKHGINDSIVILGGSRSTRSSPVKSSSLLDPSYSKSCSKSVEKKRLSDAELLKKFGIPNVKVMLSTDKNPVQSTSKFAGNKYDNKLIGNDSDKFAGKISFVDFKSALDSACKNILGGLKSSRENGSLISTTDNGSSDIKSDEGYARPVSRRNTRPKRRHSDGVNNSDKAVVDLKVYEKCESDSKHTEVVLKESPRKNHGEGDTKPVDSDLKGSPRKNHRESVARPSGLRGSPRKNNSEADAKPSGLRGSPRKNNSEADAKPEGLRGSPRKNNSEADAKPEGLRGSPRRNNSEADAKPEGLRGSPRKNNSETDAKPEGLRGSPRKNNSETDAKLEGLRGSPRKNNSEADAKPEGIRGSPRKSQSEVNAKPESGLRESPRKSQSEANTKPESVLRESPRKNHNEGNTGTEQCESDSKSVPETKQLKTGLKKSKLKHVKQLNSAKKVGTSHGTKRKRNGQEMKGSEMSIQQTSSENETVGVTSKRSKSQPSKATELSDDLNQNYVRANQRQGRTRAIKSDKSFDIPLLVKSLPIVKVKVPVLSEDEIMKLTKKVTTEDNQCDTEVIVDNSTELIVKDIINEILDRISCSEKISECSADNEINVNKTDNVHQCNKLEDNDLINNKVTDSSNTGTCEVPDVCTAGDCSMEGKNEISDELDKSGEGPESEIPDISESSHNTSDKEPSDSQKDTSMDTDKGASAKVEKSQDDLDTIEDTENSNQDDSICSGPELVENDNLNQMKGKENANSSNESLETELSLISDSSLVEDFADKGAEDGLDSLTCLNLDTANASESILQDIVPLVESKFFKENDDLKISDNANNDAENGKVLNDKSDNQTETEVMQEGLDLEVKFTDKDVSECELDTKGNALDMSDLEAKPNDYEKSELELDSNDKDKMLDVSNAEKNSVDKDVSDHKQSNEGSDSMLGRQILRKSVEIKDKDSDTVIGDWYEVKEQNKVDLRAADNANAQYKCPDKQYVKNRAMAGDDNIETLSEK